MSHPHPNKAHRLRGILNDLEQYVVSLQEQGIRKIDCSIDLAAKRSKPSRAPKLEEKMIEKARPADAPQSLPESEALKAIRREVEACKKCRLYEKRTKVVPGQGSEHPDILFVGEGPGRDEDQQGLAFVGAAGKLLTNIISAMDYEREEVFIANIVKCRPPENRKPLPEEMAACLPYLKAQIATLQPKIIVTLGATALEGLIGPLAVSITQQRGTWLAFEGIPLMPTFHPSYLLRNQSAKRPVWDDMQAVLKKLGRKPRP